MRSLSAYLVLGLGVLVACGSPNDAGLKGGSGGSTSGGGTSSGGASGGSTSGGSTSGGAAGSPTGGAADSPTGCARATTGDEATVKPSKTARANKRIEKS